MRLSDLRFALLGFVALLAVGSCRESTGLASIPRPPFALAGTWDVATVLDAYSWETGAPDLPDCPNSTLYCHHLQPATGATLSGTLVIGDTAVLQSDSGLVYANVHGSFAGQFCYPLPSLTCATPGDIVGLDYALSGLQTPHVLKIGDAFTAMIYGPSAVDTYQDHAVLLAATFAGDSLFGNASWSLSMGRDPPTWHGSFVAHRRR